MRVLLLGPFEVRDDDGEPIDIPGARLHALLTRLALDPGRVVPVEALTEAVWGEDPPAGSGNALQSLVSRARRLVGAATIESHPAGYRLAVDPGDVDAIRFERLVAEGGLEALREAERLWRGPAHLSPASAAVRLAELRLSAAEDRLALELAAGAEVLPELRNLAAAHPLRERLQGLLIQALYRSGRQAEALEAYERTRRTLADELGVDPSEELAEIHLAILRHEQRQAPRPLRAQVTTFVGRQRELAQLTAALQASRLVTVVGPGGAGKTRLAVETAAHLAGSGDGPMPVWLVELAAVADAGDVPHAVLAAIGARDSGWLESDVTGSVAEVLAGKRALLVLDNCEHVVEAAAELADRLLGACPELRVLATSRESLAIPGEILYPIPALEQAAAARLFADRAAALRPGFALEEANAGAVAEICRRLDGMPLAIELAAARMRAMTAEQIAARLDDRFRLLSGGSRTALPQHRTLEAVVDWSWEPLSEPERDLAMRLAALPGGATLDLFPDVDALAGLVDKSLVELSGDRYRMQETVRAYGMARLAESGRDLEVRGEHARHFLRLVEQADPELRGPGQLQWLDRLQAEHDNLLAALRYAADAGEAELGVRLVAGLWWFWRLQGRYTEGIHWSRNVLELPDELAGEPHAVRLVLRSVARGLEFGQASELAPIPDGQAFVLLVAPVLLQDRAAAEDRLAELTGWERTLTLCFLALELDGEGSVPEAFALLREAREILEPLGERWAMSVTLRMLAYHHVLRGEADAVVPALSRALRLAAELGVPPDVTSIEGELAVAHARQGELDRARTLASSALAGLERMHAHADFAIVHLSLAEVMLRAGDRAAFRVQAEAALAVSDQPWVGARVACLEAAAALLEEDTARARERVTSAIGLAGPDLMALATAVRLSAALEQDSDAASYLLGVAAAVRGADERGGVDELVLRAARGGPAYDRGAALTRQAAIALVTAGPGTPP
ncbi:BTAD domain-containing putative transcriptional regulator [Nonomuraea sediminis]|uniref:BTAD domain-containing putative transcriptional regulator n=1 Tax=Nonomuraea sediminis TaxID=2835864 RepID=UPI001BDC6579|nr:BTAD domain-containing putative transcriptional regulator [Nonomuraea sediminis]